MSVWRIGTGVECGGSVFVGSYDRIWVILIDSAGIAEIRGDM